MFAHLMYRTGKRVEQTIAEHCEATARYAEEKLLSQGLGSAAYLAGLLHDMGKYTARFQTYLEQAARGKEVVRGSVNHTFCGCVYLLKRYHVGKEMSAQTEACELLAHAIGAHHGEFDCVTLDGKSGFEHRLLKDSSEIGYQEAVAGFLANCASEKEIERLFLLATEEIADWFERVGVQVELGITMRNSLRGLLARLLLSAVIDGDRRDTAEFMNDLELPIKEGTVALWRAQREGLEKKLASFAADTPINHARGLFSAQCRDFAIEHGSGIYRLTLPTGAGKTLASLRYALHQGETFKKKRILFAIPLLSVLEQNAEVIHRYLLDDSIIMEHHSNVLQVKEEWEKLDEYEWLCQTWESPMILTTLVQLLNTLFSAKTSAIRRMSALSDSVIVIDEIQSLPKKTMYLFRQALNFLAYGCRATVVLCSATQPPFENKPIPLCFAEPTEIVPYQPETFDIFRRAVMVDKTTRYGMTLEELARIAEELLKTVQSLLIICNTKTSTKKLYQKLLAQSGAWKLIHLSTSMCTEHRIARFNELKEALVQGIPLICVSTQLMEAGVDLSFQCGIRVLAGIDNIAQMVGRINRHGEFDKCCKLYVVNLKGGEESLSQLEEIKIAQTCACECLLEAQASGDDPLSEAGVFYYYEKLFQNSKIHESFRFPIKLGYQTEHLFDLLATNRVHLQRPAFQGKYQLNQSFKTAGDAFRVFDEGTTDVLVPYREGEGLIADLTSAEAQYNPAFLRGFIKRAKGYIVSLFAYQMKQLQEDGMIQTHLDGRILTLDPRCYDEELGVITIGENIEAFIK